MPAATYRRRSGCRDVLARAFDGEAQGVHCGQVVARPDQSRDLTPQQAYEAAYRFVAHYYDYERSAPMLRLLQSIGWTGDAPDGNADSWDVWQDCIQQTLDHEPLPDLPPPWDG